jgi:malonyl-CoA decarboxylase
VVASHTNRRGTLDRLRDTLRRRRRVAPDLPPADRSRLVHDLEALLAERETTARRAAARRLVDLYEQLDPVGRAHVLDVLGDELGTDAARVDRAASALASSPPGAPRIRAERDLRAALTPRVAAVLHVVTGLPDGVRFLVELRGDLLEHPERDSTLGLLLDELTGHLTTLFDVGLLELRQITWDSPASVLERLIATEAVHAIRGWDDLRHRLDGDQRCYGFFHPAMANEPIVFVEVALTHGVADDLGGVLGREDAGDEPDTAIFYSITSAQPGLAGVHLGNELVKQVVDHVRAERDEIKTFATLSPLPGFRAWFAEEVRAGRLPAAERELVDDDLVAALLAAGDATALGDVEHGGRLRPALLSAAVRYLVDARDGRSRDPVANFHLSNGASLERVNWLANPEPYGIEESFGLMVNYRYDRSKMAANAGAYLGRGDIRASNQVKGLVRTTKG